jgi:maltose O-acetyltransferase
MAERSEKERMLAGELYFAPDAELAAERLRARRWARDYNATRPDDAEHRRALIRQLFGAIGSGVEIEPPFYCDYGYNIFAGDDLYMNFGCVVLDCARVTIGHGVLFGPAVQIYAATHPTDPSIRLTKRELARPVSIGNNVWVGGGAIIAPGVSIGDDTTIGAGSVVMGDIPARVIAAGNPCRVVRRLD